MKIHLANFEPERTGGGWSFCRNFVKGMGDTITNYEEADIYFVAGPTLASHDDVQKAKADGKKIVLRVDNAVRNSRNRGTGMSRLKAFCEQANLVIYQSEWAKRFLYPFTRTDGAVILNGCDLSVFNTDNRSPVDDSYLYVRSSRDEGKQWIMAWYWFIELNNQDANLDIVGKFSPENREWNFDFFNGESYTFWGEQKNMAQMYKNNRYFLYTYTNDACSNTLIEARASGCEIVDVYGMLSTGGAREIMNCNDLSIERMCKQYTEVLS